MSRLAKEGIVTATGNWIRGCRRLGKEVGEKEAFLPLQVRQSLGRYEVGESKREREGPSLRLP